MNDLQKRLVKFSADIYRIAKVFEKDLFLRNALNQIVKSSSSVGANYSEAQSAISPKDFYNKIRIALKEMKETNYWLNYLLEIKPNNETISSLESESVELLKIVGTIPKKQTQGKINNLLPESLYFILTSCFSAFPDALRFRDSATLRLPSCFPAFFRFL